MKNKYLAAIGATLITAAAAHAQVDTVTYFNQIIQDLVTFDNKIFIGGNFTQNAGQTCYWSATYDGSTIGRQTELIGGTGVRQFAVFNGELYSVGAMQFGSTIGVAHWTGSGWEDGGGTNYSHSTIYADGNDLYVVSNNGVIRKKTGSGSFQPFYDFGGNGGVGSIVRYGNKLIFAGSFTSINGVAANNIAQWDGTTWTALGTGVNAPCGNLVVYNNEVYVTGNFTTAGGQAVSKIAKWNGTSWSDVGGGITGNSANGIRKTIVYANALYILGDFDEVGNVATNDIARWNGTNWTGFNFIHPEAILSGATVFNDKLYFGSFDFTKSRLYGYDAAFVGVNETQAPQLAVYPNPSQNGVFHLENAQGATYEVRTALGQLVVSGTNTEIDLSAEKAGMYFLTLQGATEVKTIRLVRD